MKEHPVLIKLGRAVDGLSFVSETEAELVPFLWENGDALSAERVLELSGFAENARVEVTTLPRFFRAVSSEDRPRFQKLETILTENLKDIKVFKIGEVEIEAYIVGLTADGRWAGLKTTVVET